MKDKNIAEQEFKQSLPSAAGRTVKNELMVTAREGTALSPAQMQFNKLMKQLETVRVKYHREQNRLDALAAHCAQELLPLVDAIHRVNFQIVTEGLAAWKTIKLTARRRKALADLLCDKAYEIIADSSGLTEVEVGQMKHLLEELEDPVSLEETKARQEEEFDYLRSLMQGVAQRAGVKLDLSDLDFHGAPAEFERKLKERFDAAMREAQPEPSSSQSPSRKPTKAQLEREKKQQEVEEAKKRDLKSLYKQLAKVLHPDLETDPERKLQKEEWMKRLTTAHASGDLRELLSIEMEWLGVEASNLTSATDEKLKVYCTVLKEQIAEMKKQAHFLMDQPQYAVLHRFANRLMGFIPNLTHQKKDLLKDIKNGTEILNLLQMGGAERSRMINRWADDHARSMREEEDDDEMYFF